MGEPTIEALQAENAELKKNNADLQAERDALVAALETSKETHKGRADLDPDVRWRMVPGVTREQAIEASRAQKRWDQEQEREAKKQGKK